MNAKLYSVTGWQQSVEGREPLQTIDVEAEDAMDAAHQYALMFKIPLLCWNNGTKSPRVIIRVQEST